MEGILTTVHATLPVNFITRFTGTETEVRQQAADHLRSFPSFYLPLLRTRVSYAIHNYQDRHREVVGGTTLEWHLSGD